MPKSEPKDIRDTYLKRRTFKIFKITAIIVLFNVFIVLACMVEAGLIQL